MKKENDKLKELERWMDTVEFYDLCQSYRHCRVENAGLFYQHLKDAIKEKVEEL